ncbi:hypothetical protein [Bosea lathyri]|uniref:hypothetical protein n=1 Tax=Bosea lathyri TaxID=1036778 RepID=UPI0011B0F399|nr:hypothetical protein [Bosea lathyri]
MTLRHMSRRMSQILERLNERKRRAKKAAAREAASLEHRPEKWNAVFGKNRCKNKEIGHLDGYDIRSDGLARSGSGPIPAGNDNVRSGEPRKDS